MFQTTLCYIEKEHSGDVLMLYRNKKKNDPSQGKWIGVGGKLEPGETPDDCVKREVREETQLNIFDLRSRGVVYFCSSQWESEEMYLYTAKTSEDAQTIECREGELHFVPRSQLKDLNLWEGDRIFLRMLMDGKDDIHLSLRYDGDELVEVRGDQG